LWGGYVSANVSWQLDESWSVMGGVQYQNLGTYRHSFNGQQVELDLSNSFFIAVGLGYSF
jgi:long-subunit fatty acid transport protein